MKKRSFFSLAVMMTIAVNALHGVAVASDSLQISKYLLTVPEEYYVNYTGPNQQAFPKGFLTGFGSAIAFKSINKDGSIDFYGITDRGPNGDGPTYQAGAERYSSKFFPAPNFQPQIGIIRVKDGQAKITGQIGLKDEADKAITGLPIAPGLVGATNEVAIDDRFQRLHYDNHGMDTEGIALDKKGNFWICDEYGPFVAKYNKQGRLLKKYAPGEGLPEILKYRTPNRGFEGITVAPSGLIYVEEQSPLNIDGKAGATAQFTRIVQLDPKTGKTKMFAYPIDVEAYKSPNDAKIGDIYSISDTKFLMIEQGENRDKKMRNLIYLVDIKDATDLTGLKIDGKEPEFTADKKKLAEAGIKMAKKQLLVDLRENGWNIEKAEGITMLPDKKTVVVTNDNDFGMTMAVDDPENQKAKVGKYVLNADGSFTYKGKTANPRIHIVPNEESEQAQYIWFIKLPEALQ